jgi:hypothetical protein
VANDIPAGLKSQAKNEIRRQPIENAGRFLQMFASDACMKRMRYRWWHGVAFYAAVQVAQWALRAAARKLADRNDGSTCENDREAYRMERLPVFAPPGAAFPICYARGIATRPIRQHAVGNCCGAALAFAGPLVHPLAFFAGNCDTERRFFQREPFVRNRAAYFSPMSFADAIRIGKIFLRQENFFERGPLR